MKDKVAPDLRHEDVLWSKGTEPCILDLGISWR
jgi:hypothetical protein